MSVNDLKWFPAPQRTEWGDGMVVADVAIDNDHTLTLYCEESQIAAVSALLNPKAQACNELSAALGWPSGISRGPLPWDELLRQVANLRALAQE